jgi:putative hemolysin
MAIVLTQYFSYVVMILVMMVLSFFFSGTETALLSSNRMRLDGSARQGDRAARRVIGILDRIEDALSMTLIGNTIANIAVSALITSVATKAYNANEPLLLEITAVETILFLVVCEVAPKVVARANPNRFLAVLSYPISGLMMALRPATRLSLAFSGLLKRLLSMTGSTHGVVRSREEIDTLFKMGEEEGVIGEEHQQYVSEILSFKDIAAGEIMTPTIDISSVELQQSIRSLSDAFVKTKFTRLPVYDGRVDNIVGYVLYRDLLKEPHVRKIADVLNKGHFVPATIRIVDLYAEMVENLIPMVFVVNEHGAVIGMVTHEDIAEEVVGEIQARDQSGEELITALSRDRFLLSGSLDIEYFMRRFNVQIEKKRFETLAGFIAYRMGKIPKKGDRFDYDRYTFVIDEATDRSIEKVIVQLRTKKRRLSGPA